MLQEKIEKLEQALLKSLERENYYKEMAKRAGRKRLAETRELAQLVSEYRAAKDELSLNSEKLEELVQARTQEIEKTNQQLWLTIEEQKQTQQQLERLLNLDLAILEISSEFINLPVGKIDKGITSALEKIAHFTQAQQVSLNILPEACETMLTTHEWKKSSIESSPNFHDEYFHLYIERLQKRQDVIITSIKDLESLLPAETRPTNGKNFQPLLGIPMMQQGKIYGSLVLYGRAGKTGSWSKEIITFIKIMSDVFVNALEHKVSELALRESEERYRDLVEKAGVGIAINGADGSFHYFNQRFSEMFGYSEEEMTALRLVDLVHPDQREQVQKYHHDRFHRKSAPKTFQFLGLCKNGKTLYIESDVVDIAMKDQVIASRSYMRDVTQRVAAERAIHESEERYRNLVENFLDIVLIEDYQGKFLYTNPAFEQQTGYNQADFCCFADKTKLIPFDVELVAALVGQLIQSTKKHTKPFETRIRTKGGQVRYYSAIISKITYENKPALQIVAHNITEQKNAEKALKKSAEFERTVSEIMSQFVGKEVPDASIERALELIGVWSGAGRVSLFRVSDDLMSVSSTHEWCRDGVAPEINQRRFISVFRPEWWRKMLDEEKIIHIPSAAALPDELADVREKMLEHKVMSLILLPFSVHEKLYGAISFEDTQTPGRWADEDVKLLKISCEIISSAFERLEAEKMLKKSEEMYRTLFDSSNDEIYLHGFDSDEKLGLFINVNQAACSRLGYSKEELLEKSPHDISEYDDKSKIFTNLAQIIQKNHHLFETTHVTKDGSRYPVEIKSHLIEIEGKLAVLSFARDTTERKRIEEEVQKSQRLESIGVLAGGIAHDFNNLLSIILGNAQLARMMAQQSKDVTKFLLNIEQGAAQATTLTHQLLTFSKGGAPIKDVAPLGDLIRDSVRLALSGLDEQPVFRISPDLYYAEIDKGQIRQVLHNLVLNSDQAMPNGGLIEVSAKNIHSSEVNELQRLKEGPYVQITIKDSGVGIAEQDLQRIFDPYYTTKKTGSGLGLTVAYSIIKKHGGLLTLSSRTGQGTTVDIFLPAVVHKNCKITEKPAGNESYRGRIMVMDDEELVLAVAVEMLKELGFEVEGATDGEELLQLYEKRLRANNLPDVVIMDLTVPAGMGGAEAIKKLKELHPQVKALVSSGYSNDKIMSNHQEYGFAGVVAKPYSMDDLRHALAKVLKN